MKNYEDFTDRVNSGNYGELIDLATAMTEETKFYPFQTAFMFVEPGYLNGFTQEIDGFTEGFMFGPEIGSIPFVGYVFTLEDGVNAEEFVETLKSAGDLRWNICTEADEMLTGVVGDKVCFVMAPASFEE